MQKLTIKANRLGLTSWTAIVLLTATSSAMAQEPASSNCIIDPNGRMAEADNLMGTLKSTQENQPVVGNTPNDLPYLQYLPNGHDPNLRWPILVFMHGIGEVGGTLLDNTGHSIPRLVEAPWWDWPFIVISPVLPDPDWSERVPQIDAILDRVIAEQGGDPNRIYLTGLSHGGVGTYAVGIALADRVAALMPITPGGSVDGWDNRASIVNKPIWLIIGGNDNAYGTNAGWISDLEASGASPFFQYDYALADENMDAIPESYLSETHLYGTYLGLGHDVWHAAYGVYCPTLMSQKTVQYEWLLQQSLDGSPFVDPREDPTAGMNMGAAGAPAGMGGAAPVAVGGAPAAMQTAGAAPVSMGGANVGVVNPPPAAPATAGVAAVTTPPASMAPGEMTPTPIVGGMDVSANGQDPGTDGGCAVAGPVSAPRRLGLSLLALLGLVGLARRRRAASAR